MATKHDDKIFSVNRLVGVKSFSPSFVDRIKGADLDNDGNLSIEEVLKVIESEHAAAGSKKLYKRILLVVGIASLVLVAALCGITYGIVDLTKEVTTDSSNHITSSSTGDIASVGTVKQTVPVSILEFCEILELVTQVFLS